MPAYHAGAALIGVIDAPRQAGEGAGRRRCARPGRAFHAMLFASTPRRRRSSVTPQEQSIVAPTSNAARPSSLYAGLVSLIDDGL